MNSHAKQKLQARRSLECAPVSGAVLLLAIVGVGCGSSGSKNSDNGFGSSSGAATPSGSNSGSGGSSSSAGLSNNTASSSGGNVGGSGSGSGSSSGGNGSSGVTKQPSSSSSGSGSGSSSGAPGGSSGSPTPSSDGGPPANDATTPQGPSISPCLDGMTDYGNDGPFTVQTQLVNSINFYVPMLPSGCKVPVIHLSNGTGATCSAYGPALNRLATQGFLTTCYENPNTGAGDFGVTALDTALMMYPDMAANAFGSTGHSQGGQAAFTALALAEKEHGSSFIYAGLAMEPASGFGTQPTGGTWQQLYAAIVSPMFMFSGLGTDGLVSQAWVQQAYDATSMSEEAYFWTANGATHIPVPNGEEEEISVPWFRWKLLGDQAACKFFKAIPMTDTKWAEVASKNVQSCK